MQAKDPVCGMMVNTENPGGGTYEYNGQTYYFCGPGCRKAFANDPESFLKGEGNSGHGHGHMHGSHGHHGQ